MQSWGVETAQRRGWPLASQFKAPYLIMENIVRLSNLRNLASLNRRELEVLSNKPPEPSFSGSRASNGLAFTHNFVKKSIIRLLVVLRADTNATVVLCVSIAAWISFFSMTCGSGFSCYHKKFLFNHALVSVIKAC